jgi:quercetin 2,3-dioxygenase
MLTVRKAQDRGYAHHGWLETWHTFSFSSYHDPQHERFRTLRVMNEDRVAPGQGFDTHPHRDMEIVTYVLSGALEHKDSMGNGEVLRPGEFQRMTAGTGITHSEFNPSATEPVHLYQIWLFPERRGLTPSYEQRTFPADGRQGRWQRVASHDGRDGALTIHTDAEIHLANLSPGDSLTYSLPPGRAAWLQVLRGSVDVNGTSLQASDGVAVTEEPALQLRTAELAEVMLFDLP